MAEYYDKEEMINCVQQYLITTEGYDKSKIYIYDYRLEPARAPIYGIKGDDDEGQEVFVDIITEPIINFESYFEDIIIDRIIPSDPSSPNTMKLEKASAAIFYRHYFPRASVYWAIPYYTIESSTEYDEFKEACINSGVGILKIKRNSTNSMEITVDTSDPQPLINENFEQLVSKIEKFFGKSFTDDNFTEKHKKELLKLFSGFNDANLNYLVYYPDPVYRRRSVSTRDPDRSINKGLINKMSELENLSYKDILIDFSKRYHTSNDNDYEIALKITEKLWGEYDLEYPRLFKDFEDVLKLEPKYREHFLHSFQIFLFGAYVIDNLYGEIKNSGYSDKFGDRIEDAWLLAATYHDYTYMIQNFNSWTERFFNLALFVKENPASLDLTKCFIEEEYMLKTKTLAGLLDIKVDQVALSFLHEKVFHERNHAIISALSLMKYYDIKSSDKSPGFSINVINSAAKAIALHDYKIWSHISGIAVDDEDDLIGKNFKTKKFIEEIHFIADPVTFLLNLGDNLQEEGRENQSEKVRAEEAQISLEALDIKGNDVFIKIEFTGPSAKNKYKEKIGHFDNIQDFLKAGRKFEIWFICRPDREVVNDQKTII